MEAKIQTAQKDEKDYMTGLAQTYQNAPTATSDERIVKLNGRPTQIEQPEYDLLVNKHQVTQQAVVDQQKALMTLSDDNTIDVQTVAYLLRKSNEPEPTMGKYQQSIRPAPKPQNNQRTQGAAWEI